MQNGTAGRESKWQGMTLAEYVQHRNGVPLGHADSLKNMRYRSLGAGQALQVDYGQRSWAGRVVINLIYILGCLVITRLVF